MVPRPLGRTGLSVGPVGLGTVKLGRNTGVRYPEPYQLPGSREIDSLLDTALELGVNLFDTAPAYGYSELRLAPFLARHRDRVVLGTKCGERYEGEHSTWDFSAAGIEASVESSLKRLGTDRIDILLLHSDGRDAELLAKTDAVEALKRLKQSGKVRSIGISAKTAEGIDAAAGLLDVVMAPFSQADPALEEALGRAHAAGLGILAIKGLQSGRLGADAETAVRFVVGRPFIDSLVIGTLNPDHLRTAVKAAS